MIEKCDQKYSKFIVFLFACFSVDSMIVYIEIILSIRLFIIKILISLLQLP